MDHLKSPRICAFYIILGLYLNDVNSKGCFLANHFVLLSGLKALISKLRGPFERNDPACKPTILKAKNNQLLESLYRRFQRFSIHAFKN